MMARTKLHRSSTLIDPEALKVRPTVVQTNTSPDVRDLVRRNSHRKTLINFEEEIPGAPKGATLGVPGGLEGAAGQTKSVFGVDTLWERELAKLKAIEAQEKEEEEERKRLEEAEEAQGKKKKHRGKHKKDKDGKRISLAPTLGLSPSPSTSPALDAFLTPSPTSDVSPQTRKTMNRPPPLPAELRDVDDEPEEESESSSVAGKSRAGKNTSRHDFCPRPPGGTRQAVLSSRAHEAESAGHAQPVAGLRPAPAPATIRHRA